MPQQPLSISVQLGKITRLHDDLRTARFTRWLHYPVRFASLAGARPVEKDLRRALG